MSKESDMSLFNDVLEPFRKVINTDSPKDKLSASPKLNFSPNDVSSKEGLSINVSAKRKLSHGSPEGMTPEKHSRIESINTSIALSPWETKRLKIDLAAAKATIVKLEARVQHQHAIRREMQLLFEEEKSSLVDQHERDKKALTEMEKRLEVVRKREQDLKEEHSEALKDFQNSKRKWDKDKADFQKQILDLKDELHEANVSSKDQLSEMKKDMDELLQALEASQAEVDILKTELAKQTSRAEQCTLLRTQLEKQTFELQQVTSKLKEIEYERDSFKDWQQQAKTAQKRLSKMAELEKEVTKLRTSEKTLKDAVCNKLLLEEQVHLLTTRVEALQPVQQELHETKVKLAVLESALEEWKNAARAHGAESPKALKSALESALSGQLTALAGCSEAKSQTAQLVEEIATVKFERDKATAKLNDLTSVNKNQQSLIHRLQKRLLLVTRERDSYRQQLDCYEKELTVTMCGESGTGSNALLSARVEQLEKALQGYRDLLSTHDQEGDVKALENIHLEVSKWREEAEAARREANKLRLQRDQLQMHIERLAQTPSTKILHMVDNPAAAAHKQMQVDMEKAQEEIKKLKAALKDGVNTSVNAEEIQQLRQQLKNSRIKLERIKAEVTSSAQDFRDVVYMLLGYKVDRMGPKKYRISNMYAESEDDYLTFNLCDEDIKMVHTDYTASLEELVKLHLHQNKSMPMFLSALTIELFKKMTIQRIQ